MHDVIVQALLHGVPDGVRPWSREETVTFLAPVPGLRPALLDLRAIRHPPHRRADDR